MTVIIDRKAPTGKECALSANYRLLCKMIKEYGCDKVQGMEVLVKEQRGPLLKAPKSNQAFNSHAGQKFFAYPWKLLIQVFYTILSNNWWTRLGCMKEVVLAVRRWLAIQRDVDMAVSVSRWEVGRSWWMSLFWDCTAPRRGRRTQPLLSIHAVFLSARPKMAQDLPPQHDSIISG